MLWPLRFILRPLMGSQHSHRLSNEGLYMYIRHTPTLTSVSLSAGRLSYDVDPQRKELSVVVSDMLEDHNYHLRLCHKDFICLGTGTNTLVSVSICLLETGFVLQNFEYELTLLTDRVQCVEKGVQDLAVSTTERWKKTRIARHYATSLSLSTVATVEVLQERSS